ncbi:MAG: type II secretion system protein [Candidatus Sungbacteria bacterium]|uniref:Type II secretion system protein n=1 Tax=Candidatus Sungiibacteriota bacterium TaxID=2750080 RepID=A0A931SD43_9BACT|nr:type II secretion system protein [Candidatus Sungbacteria bacterium]
MMTKKDFTPLQLGCPSFQSGEEKRIHKAYWKPRPKGRVVTGFTLIELLIVIAIIGLLASIVLSSLSTGRSKSRDAQRVANLQQVRTALELYVNTQPPQLYPAGYICGNGTQQCTYANLGTLLAPYLSSLPKDPLTGNNYRYCGLNSGNGYILEAVLENNNRTLLDSDLDTVTNCPGGGNSIQGIDSVAPYNYGIGA